MARRWDDQTDENMLQNPLPPTQYGVTDEEKAKWNNKQDALEFDDEPTEFSSKMLNSSVVFTALKKVQNALTSAYKRYVDVVLDDLSNIPAFTKLANLVNTMHEKVGSIDKKVASIDEKVTNYPDPNSKADKNNTVLTGSISLGRKTGTNVGASSFAVGHAVTARAKYSHAEGWETKAHAPAAHAEGYQTSAGHANATDSVGDGWYAHAEGQGSEATHRAAHAEGCLCKANADFAHAEGQVTAAAGSASHAEGNDTLAQSKGCHAEGSSTVAGNAAPKTGVSELAQYEVGSFAHSQGIGTLAKGSAAHAEGYKTRAEGAASHSEGDNTVAAGNYQHAQGRYNVVDFNNQYAHIVGGGSSDTDRKNIHTVDWQGNAEYAGDVIANGFGQTSPVSLLQLNEKVSKLVGSPSSIKVSELTKKVQVEYSAEIGDTVLPENRFLYHESCRGISIPVKAGDVITVYPKNKGQVMMYALYDKNNVKVDATSYHDFRYNDEFTEGYIDAIADGDMCIYVYLTPGWTEDEVTLVLPGSSTNTTDCSTERAYSLFPVTLQDVMKEKVMYLGDADHDLGNIVDESKIHDSVSNTYTQGMCVFKHTINEGDMLLFTIAHRMPTKEWYSYFIVTDENDVVVDNVAYRDVVSNPRYMFEATDDGRTGGVYEFQHSGTLYMCFPYTDVNVGEFFYIKTKSSNEPVVLYQHGCHEDETFFGDLAMDALMNGRQILIRLDNYDGGKYTALYSPVYRYDVPNYQNNYIYLHYIQDYQRELDLSALGMGTITIPTFAQMKLKTSKTYNVTPLL